MSILANALPGFRDIRAALVAGYLWLLFGWLLFGDTLTDQSESRFIRDLTDLASTAGPVWTAIAIGVAAYLLGLISRDVSRGLVHLARQVRSVRWEVAEEAVAKRAAERRARRQWREQSNLERALDASRTLRSIRQHRAEAGFAPSSGNVFAYLVEAFRDASRFLLVFIEAFGAIFRVAMGPLVPSLAATTDLPGDLLSARVRLSLDRSDPIVRQLVEDRARDATAALNQAAQEDISEFGGGVPTEAAGIESLAADRRRAMRAALDQLAEGLQRELDLPATLLVADQPELFAEVDRIRAESELRGAVIPPLIAVAVLLAAEASLWWLWALAPLFQLLVQAVRREDDARRLMGSALLVGRVESGAVARFDRTLDELRARRTRRSTP